MRLKTLKAALPYTLPVFIGYLFLGIAFGVLLSSKGYNFIWAVFMSVIIYAGSMQFVAINILTGGFNIASTALLTLMVNARHLFYGLSMLDKFKDMGRKKPYMIFSLTDETYSLLCSVKAPEGMDQKRFNFCISALNHSYWILGSAIGGIAGTMIKFNSRGIDFAMTALFTVIFVEQWEHSRNHIPAAAGIAVTIICLLVFGPGKFIIFSMIGILLVLLLLRRQIER